MLKCSFAVHVPCSCAVCCTFAPITGKLRVVIEDGGKARWGVGGGGKANSRSRY